MAGIDPNSCEHDWQPYIQYLGRYKCSLCDGHGYAGRSSFGHHGLHAIHSGSVLPYVCGHKHCESVATECFGQARFCKKHKKDGKSSKKTDKETIAYYKALAKEEDRVREVNRVAMQAMRAIREEALG